MSVASRTATSLVRGAARQQLPALRSSAAVMQQRNAGTDASTSHAEFKSPFHRGTTNQQDTTVIPSFKDYRNKSGETGNKMFQYFMVGAFGGISALGAKNTVQGELGRMGDAWE
jgi:ubiquinol-cytochrome c reductase iron-sulfur subunit